MPNMRLRGAKSRQCSVYAWLSKAEAFRIVRWLFQLSGMASTLTGRVQFLCLMIARAPSKVTGMANYSKIEDDRASCARRSASSLAANPQCENFTLVPKHRMASPPPVGI